MGKNIGKNIGKNLSSKSSQKLLDHARQSATDALKIASKIAFQKTKEATGELIGNTFADKIIKASRTLSQNNSGTVESETENTRFDREIPEERCISPEKRQQILNVII